jgi:hypothetical protein
LILPGQKAGLGVVSRDERAVEAVAGVVEMGVEFEVVDSE